MAGGSVYEQLLAAGADPRDIRCHESDLYVKVTDESAAWLAGYEFKSNVTRFAGADGTAFYDVPFGFMDIHVAAKEGEAPSPADISAMAGAGFPCADTRVLGEDDVVFAGGFFEIEREDPEGGGAPDRRLARVTCYFEPKSAGGPAWNCCVEMEYGFMSMAGGRPDVFADAHGAIRCMLGYTGAGGLVEELGWKVSGL